MKSQPQDKVIDSVVERCAPEWYRFGLRLGYKDGKIQAMTYNIPTLEGKLQVIVEIRAKEDGREATVEALLDVCDQIMPQATVAVMEDLGIKSIGTGEAFPFGGTLYVI